jgi:hypothetical protein
VRRNLVHVHVKERRREEMKRRENLRKKKEVILNGDIN